MASLVCVGEWLCVIDGKKWWVELVREREN